MLVHQIKQRTSGKMPCDPSHNEPSKQDAYFRTIFRSFPIGVGQTKAVQADSR